MKEKKIVAAALLWLAGAGLFAEAPELRSLLPSSWRRMERVTGRDEEDAVRQVSRQLDAVRSFPQSTPAAALSRLTDAAVYRQRAGGAEFYRVLLTAMPLELYVRHVVAEGNYTAPQWDALRSPEHILLQALFYRGQGGLAFVAADVQGEWRHSNADGWQVYYGDFALVPLEREGQVGLWWLSASVPVETGQTREGLLHVRFFSRDQRPAGRQSAVYRLLEVRAGGALAQDVPLAPGGGTSCAVEASDFLFVPSCPLRHSLLGALDGDPGTAYVENSEDNGIFLRLRLASDDRFAAAYGKIRVTQAAVINGDGRDRAAYLRGNRVAAFAVKASCPDDPFLGEETLSFSLKDYRTEAQSMYLPFGAGMDCLEFHTAGLYRGQGRNDTGIAGFNIKLAGFGWLFGRLDE